MEVIASEENIKLAYRNIKKNKGSKTAGTDGKTIKHLAKWQDERLIQFVRKKLAWYEPQAVRRVEIPKGNGKTRPLGIPTIMDRLIPVSYTHLDILSDQVYAYDRENERFYQVSEREETWDHMDQGFSGMEERNMSEDVYASYADEVIANRCV